MSKVRRRVLKGLLVVLTAGFLGLVLGMGTASAYFRAVGVGTGVGETATTVAITLDPGTVSPGLYPGASATVVTVADNPSSVPVRIGSLTLDTSQGTSGFAVDSGHAGCSLTTFAFSTQTNGGAGWTVPANGSLTIMLPGSVSATLATASACQGATLTAYLRAAA